MKVCPCCNEQLTDAGLIVLAEGEEDLGVEPCPGCADTADGQDDELRPLCVAAASEQPEAQP